MMFGMARRFTGRWMKSRRRSGRRLVLLSGILALIFPHVALAQGGCGSVCLPLEVLDPERTQVQKGKFRVLITTEYADFDNFRVGDEDVFNPGGNEAILKATTLFLDYGVSERFTISVLVPYVEKRQQTNRFDQRISNGVGDVALFGRYEAIVPDTGKGPSLALGLGVKFPTGDIEQPGGSVARLPPAFQAGSGAYDLFPTISYFQNFSSFSLFGSSFLRIPLEENKLGYEFGQELEIHFGVRFPLPIWKQRAHLIFSLDYLDAERDEDTQMTLPARLRDGTTVLNSGGEFLDFTPGFQVFFTEQMSLQARFYIPIEEDWNGLASRNVGQVAPDLTTQLTFTYVVR